MHAPSSSQFGAAGASAGAHVLVVDDEPDILEMSSWLLEHEGHRVSTADNGRTAIEVALAGHPDLVVLDVTMPDMDGTEVALTLRRHPETASIRIVIHTAMDEPWVAARFAAYDRFLQKPCTSDGLVRCVASVLGTGSARPV